MLGKICAEVCRAEVHMLIVWRQAVNFGSVIYNRAELYSTLQCGNYEEKGDFLVHNSISLSFENFVY